MYYAFMKEDYKTLSIWHNEGEAIKVILQGRCKDKY
jgi:hypothetical protein